MSLINSIYQSDIEELNQCFKETEKKVKQLELYTLELSIPSINQLRYVSYHLLKASDINNLSVDIVQEEIKKALHHCQRAKFDAIEIWITHLLGEIKTFEEKYSSIKETQDVIKNYSSYLTDTQNAVDSLNIISDEEKKKETRRFIIQVILSLLGVIIALALLADRTGYFHINQEKTVLKIF